MSSRRDFIKKLAATTAGAAAGGIPAVIQKALAQTPNSTTRSINDVEHIVILMNENRSFDHYFGTLNGVRGLSDSRAIRIRENANSNDKYVYQQDSGIPNTGPIKPFPINGVSHINTDGFFAQGLTHTRKHQIEAWNYGKMNAFCSSSGSAPHAMGYFTRADIPFYYALADAFTICDAYHAAALANTHLNRAMLMSGRASEEKTDPSKLLEFATGGYAGDNPDFSNLKNSLSTLKKLDSNGPLTWTTIAERLQDHGVTWQVYQNGTNNDLEEGTAVMVQNIATEKLRHALGSCGWCYDKSNPENFRWSVLNNGLLAGDNYNCNALPYFSRFSDQRILPELKDRGLSIKNLNAFADDVKAGTLPKVSWIIPPYAFSEHPGVELGAPLAELYVSTILEALVSNPEVWKKTVFLLTYDEGDGWFDHMPPPMPVDPDPATRLQGIIHPIGELETSTNIPVGLGKRVPLIAISPWSTGGWVSSAVFDHTSIVRFICTRFNIDPSFLSDWRTSISGDLSSIFNFTEPRKSSITQRVVNSTVSRLEKVYSDIPKKATNPVAHGKYDIIQESDWRFAHAVPYSLSTKFNFNGSTPSINLYNKGDRGAVFQIYQLDGSGTKVFHRTIDTNESPAVQFSVTGKFNICVYGPNGFYREYAGDASDRNNYTVECGATSYDDLIITVSGAPAGAAKIDAKNETIYKSGHPKAYTLNIGPKSNSCVVQVNQQHRWYDFNLTLSENTSSAASVILAGHIENGKPSLTDPLFGEVRW